MHTMGNFDRGGRGGGRSFGGGRSSGYGDRRGGFSDRGSRDRGSFGGDRPMHQAICSNCGRECEVPFRPTGSKPVYCSNCFEKMGNDRGADSAPRRSNYQAPAADQNKNQFESLNSKLETINVKLDKLMNLLEKTEKPASVPLLVAKALKEAKPLKVKKETKKPAVVKKA